MSRPANGDRRPIDPDTGNPLPERPDPGYYPGYRTMDQQETWDDATRKVVLKRINEKPPIRFFTGDEYRLMCAVCDCLLPQYDRSPESRIPIVNTVDDRLYNDRIDGFQYGDMPPDPEAYRLGLKAIEAIAARLFEKSFVDLDDRSQQEVLATIHDGKPPAGEAIWEQMPVNKFWLLILGDTLEAYYAHPYAWDEIGFGGPAYPRGYMRLNNGQPEPWEVKEQRYRWTAPPGSPSAKFGPVGGKGSTQPAGQEGTH